MSEQVTTHSQANVTHNVDEGEIFEVFQQDQKDPAPHHGGNLRAPDSGLAIHYGKEFYGRRQESQRLWIMPRAAMWEISSDTVQQQPTLHPLSITATATIEEEQKQTIAVFGQKQGGKPLVWIQDYDETSLNTVVEVMMQVLQSDEYIRIWLCPRSVILELTNPDLLQPPLDRSYRRLDGYNIREKLRAARQRVQAQGDVVHE